MSNAHSGFNGSTIDGSVFTTITNFAQATPFLHKSVIYFSTYGWIIFLVLIIAAWYFKPRTATDKIPNLLAILFSIITVGVIDKVLKHFFQELRPCRSLPQDFILAHCPSITNYSFPSGHSLIAASFAVSIYFLHNRIGVIAGIVAVLQGLSRIYIGAHYPHDVFIGLCLGALIAAVVGQWFPALVQHLKPYIKQ